MRQLVLWLCLLAAGPAFAADSVPSVDAVALLARANHAAGRLDYRGVFVRQRGDEISATRITHRRAGKRIQEKLESLDGRPSETVRNGNTLVTYLPGLQRKVVESRVQGPGFPAIAAPSAEHLARYYVAKIFAGERIAERPATALALDARDKYHFSYRFWFDTASGLLLRAQRVSEQGEVVEQVSFVDLTLGRQAASRVRATYTDTSGWRVVNLAAEPADLGGWTVSWLPGAFQRIGSVTRTMSSEAEAAGREVSQILFSDGLAGLSIFIEPWTPERSTSPLQLGAVNMVGKRYGKFWLTIVGEVPMAAIRQVADSVEFAQTFPR